MTPSINMITILAIILSLVLSPAISQQGNYDGAQLNDGLLQSDIELTPTSTLPGIESGYPPPGGEATPTPQISPTPTAPTPTQITPTPTALPPEPTPTETSEVITLSLIPTAPILLEGQPIQLNWKINSNREDLDLAQYQLSLKVPEFLSASETLEEFTTDNIIRVNLAEAPSTLEWETVSKYSGPVTFYATLEQDGNGRW